MKTISASLLLASVLLLSSCIFSIKKKDRDFNQSEVIGKWEITKSSLRQVKREKEEYEIITAFVLKADSTLDATWGVSKPLSRTGTWKWQPEKRIGTEKIGLNVKFDVFLVSANQILGFNIYEEDNELFLNAGRYEYKKQ